MVLGQAQTANQHHRGALAAFRYAIWSVICSGKQAAAGSTVEDFAIVIGCRKAIQLEQSPGARLQQLKAFEAEADTILQKTQAEKGS